MKVLLFVFLSVLPFSVFANCDFPVPNYQISVKSNTGISEKVFNKVIDDIESKYKSIFKNDYDCPLVFHRSWENGTINAQAWQENGKCHVEMFGGLARYPGMTKITFYVVALHEIGHHLAGHPFYTGETLSVEGQSDFYATSIGMRLMKKHSKFASMRMASILAELSGEDKPSRPGPKLPKVDEVYEEHPEAQCRLNTYDAGRIGLHRPRCWYIK